MDTYDLEPPNRNAGLIVSGIVVIVIALIAAGTFIYKHKNPTVVNKSVRVSPKEAAAEIARTKEIAVLGAEIVGIVVLAAFQVYLMIWVARDCRNRSDDAGALWAFVVFLIPLIGIVVYLSSRPKGMLVQCSNCPNKRLPYVAACPHCGR